MAELASDRLTAAQWVDVINGQRKGEEDWRKEAEKSVATFRAESKGEAKNVNLYHANVSVMVPASFNSTPIPDVRRRYADRDPVGRVAAEVIERALVYSLDVYDFDQQMRLCVYDMALAGRGVVRVVYDPTLKMSDMLKVETVTDQDVKTEYVPWQHFVRGDAITWETLPWLAFEHFMTKAQVRKLAPNVADKLEYVHDAPGADDDKRRSGGSTPDALKRARLYEIWDKENARVMFVCPEWTDEFVRDESDPLGLEGFFPVPRPVQFIAAVGGLTPVCPLTVYRGLNRELEDISRRINRLIKQLRPRGGYAGNAEGIKAIAEAGDGELVSLTGIEEFLNAGGIEKALTWFPLEPTVLAIRELSAQRETIKQLIYEVTGVADIMRGASNPGDTATAQRLKSQYGSVRMRDIKDEVARLARDLLRLKAEIIARHFTPAVLMEMTGIPLPSAAEKQQAMQMAQANPQQAQAIAQQNPELAKTLMGPSAEEVFQLLRSSKMRSYRIDIETDSTVRGDVARDQEQMASFLSGTSQYMAAMGPAVQQGQFPPDVAVEIYSGFARKFQLGKSVEDALDRLSQSVQQMAPQAKKLGEQDQPGGEAAGKAQIEAMRLQFQQAADEAKRQAHDRELEMNAQIEGLKAQLKVYEIDTRDKRERDFKAADLEQRGRDNALRAFSSMQPTTGQPQV